MAKKQNVFLSSEEAVRRTGIDLKNAYLAGFLAWLVPGLGHFYQGRNAKGAIFMLSITSLLLFGIYVGQGNGQTMAQVVHASPEPFGPGGAPLRSGLFRAAGNHWKFVCQAGVGAVAIPALVQRHRERSGNEPLGPWFRSPSMRSVPPTTDSQGNLVEHPNELAKWNYEAGFYFELGAVYAVIAGLLNVLAVYDAANGPLLDARMAGEEPSAG